VRAQVQNKEKERKILELTMRELDTIPAKEDKMFRGVGKMWVLLLGL
jgi:prefoldin subunit 1